MNIGSGCLKAAAAYSTLTGASWMWLLKRCWPLIQIFTTNISDPTDKEKTKYIETQILCLFIFFQFSSNTLLSHLLSHEVYDVKPRVCIKKYFLVAFEKKVFLFGRWIYLFIYLFIHSFIHLKFMDHGIQRIKRPAAANEKRLSNEHAHYVYQQIK